MKEEKQLIEYKEPRGIFHWLRSKFEKLKEIFGSKKNLKSEQDWSEYELTEEELDDVKGGIPIPTKVVDKEELMANLGIKEPKSWELTPSERDAANARNIVEKSDLEEGELTEEELDEIKGGQPIIDDGR